jgi:hypothetical protein
MEEISMEESRPNLVSYAMIYAKENSGRLEGLAP